ncbi:MAG: VCBS repeat-containing protein [Planctomycetota bacterium]|nr:MAG: VCBS repeat-containing protein [Planctomycetota bacterium]
MLPLLLVGTSFAPAAAPPRFDFDDALHAALARAGDVDGDKVEDFIAMDRVSGGPLVIVSGWTGERIRVLEAATPEWNFGRSLACAGDLNTDGVPDQLVGGFGAVRIYSGRDGSVLRELRPATPNLGFGFHVAGEGELDGDGVPDFLVVTDATSMNYLEGRRRTWGAPPALETQGRVDLYSGKTGAPIRYALPLAEESPLCVALTVPPCGGTEWPQPAPIPAAPFQLSASKVVLGRAAAFLPDRNGDGFSELAIVCHAPGPIEVFGDPNQGKEGGGLLIQGESGVFVDVRSGADGARLTAFGTTYLPANHEGWLVGSAGDIDGDGAADPYLAVLNQELCVFSGKTNAALLRVHACGGNLNGAYTSVAALGDIDGDGRGEIGFAANEVGFDSDGGMWCVLDHKSRALKFEHLRGLVCGFEISAAGDLDGDKVLDFVVLEHTRRSVRAHSGKDFAELWKFSFDAPVKPGTR